MSKYTIKLEEDGYGNLIIPFTAELLEEVGWKEFSCLLLILFGVYLVNRKVAS